MKQGLIIGRFQPLCNHHVQFFKNVLDEEDHLLIGVGQPNYTLAKEKLGEKDFELYKLQYMFDFQTVKNWIHQVIDEENITILPVHDVFDSTHFGNYVQGEFEKVGVDFSQVTLYGENPRTLGSFSIKKKHIEQIGTVHASDVRKEILETGKSEGLAMTLESKQLETIVKAEKNKTIC